MPILSVASALERSLLGAVCVCALGIVAAIVTMHNAIHEITARRASHVAMFGLFLIVAILGGILAFDQSGPAGGSGEAASLSLFGLISPGKS
jgi:uncharacterized membrane protein